MFPAAAILLLIAVSVLGRGIYPSLIQKFQVIPNEIVAETPYLEKNIRYTRLAYGLTQIEEQEFPTEENLTAKDLQKNNLTVKNIRLWNHAPLLQTYASSRRCGPTTSSPASTTTATRSTANTGR